LPAHHRTACGATEAKQDLLKKGLAEIRYAWRNKSVGDVQTSNWLVQKAHNHVQKPFGLVQLPYALVQGPFGRVQPPRAREILTRAAVQTAFARVQIAFACVQTAFARVQTTFARWNLICAREILFVRVFNRFVRRSKDLSHDERRSVRTKTQLCDCQKPARFDRETRRYGTESVSDLTLSRLSANEAAGRPRLPVPPLYCNAGMGGNPSGFDNR